MRGRASNYSPFCSTDMSCSSMGPTILNKLMRPSGMTEKFATTTLLQPHQIARLEGIHVRITGSSLGILSMHMLISCNLISWNSVASINPFRNKIISKLSYGVRLSRDSIQKCRQLSNGENHGLLMHDLKGNISMAAGNHYMKDHDNICQQVVPEDSWVSKQGLLQSHV